jgi:hypothetical protein
MCEGLLAHPVYAKERVKLARAAWNMHGGHISNGTVTYKPRRLPRHQRAGAQKHTQQSSEDFYVVAMY